jgi:ribosomal-protein-alanine N-acetyltransferase
VKVLEAMAMQRVVVSTSTGCAGLGLEHNRDVWVADGAAAFAEGVSSLLKNPAERKRLADAALELVRQRYDWRAIAEGQRALWRELSRSPLVVRPGHPGDVPAIALIQEGAPEAAQWNPADYLQHEVLVAVAGEDVVGFVAFRRTVPEEWEVLNLGVAVSWRRAGIGHRLLEAALARMTGDTYLEVRASNVAAIGLYEQFGFRKISVRPAYYGPLGPSASPESGIVMHYRKC